MSNTEYKGGYRIVGHKKGGGGSGRTPVESPDSLHSTTYVRILDLLSEGEIEGLVNGLQSVVFDSTPLQNADGSYNFENVVFDYRSGTQDQEYIKGFNSVESTTGVGVELKSTAPWTRSFTNRELSAVKVTLGVDGLTQTNTSNGDITGYLVEYKIELQTDNGPWVLVKKSSFNGKTTSAYRRTHRIDLPKATSGWSIRVTRLTPEANKATISDRTVVDYVVEVIDAKLRYPNSALAGLYISAEQFSSIPTRAYHLRGKRIRVPSNYDPVNRTYSGTWDGTFKVAYSNNPAWVLYDLATSKRYGLGKRINPAVLNKGYLYQIGMYCDELVPSGKPDNSLEPRFTCNLYLQQSADAYKVLQDIVSIFRGMMYWSNSSAIVTSDMPRDPVFVYNQTNVVGGRFSYAGTELDERYTVALVSYSDMTDMGRQKVAYVQDIDAIRRYGVNKVELTAFGCTSEGQALRVGKWAISTSIFETQTVSFAVDRTGQLMAPGKLIKIMDSAFAGKRHGGRVVEASTSVVKLDGEVTAIPGDVLTVNMPNGLLESRYIQKVVTVSGTSTVTVTAPFTQEPKPEASWAVDTEELATRLFSIVNVKDNEDGTFAVTAIQHEPQKFAHIETGIVIAPKPATTIPPSVQPPVGQITVSQFDVKLADGSLSTTVALDWQDVKDTAAYEIAWNRSNSGWVTAPKSPTSQFQLQNCLPGDYIFKVRSTSAIGINSQWTYTDSVSVIGDGKAPKNYDTFSVTEVVGGLRKVSFAFLNGTPSDVVGAEIRYIAGTPANLTWEAMTPLISGHASSGFTTSDPAAGLWTFAIKSRSRAGKLAESMFTVQVNLVETFDPNTTPDLTQPPAPTGLSGFVGLSVATLKTDKANYTQGHGHKLTRYYAAEVVQGQSAPSFASASVVAESADTYATANVTVGKTYRFWATWVSNDGVESVQSATYVDIASGKVGDAELSDDIDLASKLADGSISGSKLAQASLDSTKFAQSIQPVTIWTGSSLPTTKRTDNLTWNGKLYTWNGTSYVLPPAGELSDGSVTAQKIAAGAVNAAKIAAGVELVKIWSGGTLPTTSQGSVLSWNGKLYRWDGTKYSAEVATADLTGQIDATKLADNAVTVSKIASGAVDAGKLASNAVTTDKIAAGAVNVAKFASGLEPVTLVTGASLPTTKSTTVITWNGKLYRWDGAKYSAEVATADLAGQIDSTKLADNAVTVAKIAAGAVEAGKLASNAVTTDKIAAGAVNVAKFASGLEPVTVVSGSVLPTTKSTEAITFQGKLYRWDGTKYSAEVPTSDLTGQIDSAKLADNAVTVGKIAAGAVDAGKLAANAVTAEKLASASVDVTKFASGIEPVTNVAGTTVPTVKTTNVITVSGKLYRWDGTKYSAEVPAVDLSGTITSTQIADNAVTTGKLAANSVVAGKIAANAVTATELAANSVTTAKIAASAVTAAEIAAGAVTASKVVVSDVSTLVPDADYGDSAMWFGGQGGTVSIVSTTNPEYNTTASRALQLNRTQSANDWDAGYSSTFPIQSNTGYRVRSSVYFPAAGRFLLRMTTYATDNSSAGYRDTDVTVTGAGFQFVEFTYTTAVNAAFARIFLYIHETSAATYARLGKVYVQERTTSSLIVDGAITADKIAAKAVTAAQIAAGTITGAEIAANTITAGKIAAGTITATELATNAVTADKIASNSVTTAKIAANAVTANEISANAVTTAKIAAGAVTAAEVAAGAITASKLLIGDTTNLVADPAWNDTAAWSSGSSNYTFEAAEAADNAARCARYSAANKTGTANGYSSEIYGAFVPVEQGRTLALSIRIRDYLTAAGVLQLGIVTKKANGTTYTAARDTYTLGAVNGYTVRTGTYTVAADDVSVAIRIRHQFTAAGTFNGPHKLLEPVIRVMQSGELIVDGAITAAKIAAKTITAGEIAAGAITATELGAGSVTAGKIAAGSITATELASNSVTATQLAANSVVAGKIAANAITAGTIAANAVTTATIAAGAVTATEIAAGAITASKMVLADTSNAYPDFDIQDGDGYSSATPFSFASANSSFGSRRVVHIPASSAAGADATVWTYATTGFQLEPNSSYFVSLQTARQASATATLQVLTRLGVKTGNTTVTWDAEVLQNSDAAASTSVYKTFVVTTGTRTRMQLGFRLLAGAATGGYFGSVTVRKMGGGELIVDGAITATKIAAKTITAAEIAAGAITATELATNSVTTAKVQAGAITANELATNSVTAVKVAAGAITAGKIAANAVTANEIASNSVTTAKIAAGAVTAAEIAANAITVKHLTVMDYSNIVLDPFTADTSSWATFGGAMVTRATAGVPAGMPGPSGVQLSKSVAQEVRSRNFQTSPGEVYYMSAYVASATTTGLSIRLMLQLIDGTGTEGGIDGAHVNWATAVTTTAASVAANTWTKIEGLVTVPAGAVFGRARIVSESGTAATGNWFATNFVCRRAASAELIVDGAITTQKLDALAVTAAKLAANSVTAGAIAANAVTAGKIAANAVTAGTIAAGAVSADQIAANAITASKLVVADRSNMLSDTEFKDLVYWYTNMVTSTDAAAVAALNCSPVMTNVAGSTSNTELYNRAKEYFMSVEPGKAYHVSLDVYIAAGWNGRGQLNLQGYTSNGSTGTTSGNAYTTDYRTTPAAAATTVSLEFDYTATSTTAFVRFRFLASYTNAAVAGLFIGNPRVRLKQDASLIVDGAITATKLAANSIAVGTAAIQSGAIVNAHIGDLSADKINAGTLNAARIAAGSLNADKLVSASITATQLATNAVTADKISAGAITSAKILAGAVTADKLTVSNLAAISANMGTVTAGRIQNAANTSFWDLTATGATQMLKLGSDLAYSESTGLVINKLNVIGTAQLAPGSVSGVSDFSNAAKYTIWRNRVNNLIRAIDLDPYSISIIEVYGVYLFNPDMEAEYSWEMSFEMLRNSRPTTIKSVLFWGSYTEVSFNIDPFVVPGDCYKINIYVRTVSNSPRDENYRYVRNVSVLVNSIKR